MMPDIRRLVAVVEAAVRLDPVALENVIFVDDTEPRNPRPDTLSDERVAEVPEATENIKVVIVALDPDAFVNTRVGITPEPVRVRLEPEAELRFDCPETLSVVKVALVPLAVLNWMLPVVVALRNVNPVAEAVLIKKFPVLVAFKKVRPVEDTVPNTPVPETLREVKVALLPEAEKNCISVPEALPKNKLDIVALDIDATPLLVISK